MDWGVHRVGANGALEQLVDARGGGSGSGSGRPHNVGRSANICRNRVRGLRGGELWGVVGERVVSVVAVETAVVEITDLRILIRFSISGGDTLNAVQFHHKLTPKPKVGKGNEQLLLNAHRRSPRWVGIKISSSKAEIKSSDRLPERFAVRVKCESIEEEEEDEWTAREGIHHKGRDSLSLSLYSPYLILSERKEGSFLRWILPIRRLKNFAYMGKKFIIENYSILLNIQSELHLTINDKF